MSKKRQDQLTYREYNNSVCLTLHTLDGSELTFEAQEEAENALWEVAQRYGLVINIATV